MAMAQYFPETVAQNASNEKHEACLEKWNSVTSTVDESENSPSGGFDCNICLDCVQDPVITLCGHLYCWPCIYKWIHYQNVSAEKPDQEQPQCPICKSEISESTLVPLYGRGQTTKPSEGKTIDLGIVIPRRPPSPRCGVQTNVTSPTSSSSPAQQLHQHSHRQQAQPHFPQRATPILSLGGPTATNMPQPTLGMYGEMVYSRIFGNSATTVYAYPNSYDVSGSTSPRMRRHVMEVDKSLSRVCFFLFCCTISCLVLF